MSVTSPGGHFDGTSFRQLMVLFTALSGHDAMRKGPDGRSVSRGQRQTLETSFRLHHSLSASQYQCLVDLYDKSDLSGVYAEMQTSLPPAVPGMQPARCKHFFQAAVGPRCCGRNMRTRTIDAMAFSRDDCFPTKHIVKACVGQCRATYYLNNMRKERLGDRDVPTHTFYSWVGGIPDWISNKSGKIIVSTGLITDFTIALCTLRRVRRGDSIVCNLKTIPECRSIVPLASRRESDIEATVIVILPIRFFQR